MLFFCHLLPTYYPFFVLSGDADTGGAPVDRSQRQFTPQLSSESDGEPPAGARDAAGGCGPAGADPPGAGGGGPGGDLLSRYLESLSARSRGSRDDSQNSSDSECSNGRQDGEEEGGGRRSRVNMRVLEERLNMIQEECNRLSDESDDERSATNDDRSDVVDKDENDNNNVEDMLMEDGDILGDGKSDNNNKFDNVFDRFEDFLDNNKTRRTGGRSRSEGKNNNKK